MKLLFCVWATFFSIRYLTKTRSLGFQITGKALSLFDLR